MPVGLRKFALASHVALSVSLLGAIGSFLALAIVGLATRDPLTVRMAYPAMALTAHDVVVPLAIAALAGGIVQGLGTRWGLFRHYWVVAKLLLTDFATSVLLVKLSMVDFAARAAEGGSFGGDFSMAQMQLVAHAAGGLLLLLIPVLLSIYKPWGMTRLGLKARHT
jgi:hypothetical protein